MGRKSKYQQKLDEIRTALSRRLSMDGAWQRGARLSEAGFGGHNCVANEEGVKLVEGFYEEEAGKVILQQEGYDDVVCLDLEAAKAVLQDRGVDLEEGWH